MYDLRCMSTLPALPQDIRCDRRRGHPGPHERHGRAWTNEEAEALTERVYAAEEQAAQHARYRARWEVLGAPSPGARVMGVVGNRAQRRAGMKRR